MSMDPPKPLQRTRVWDLPTRAFHWLLTVAVVAAVATGQIGGNAMVWHLRIGLVVMALLVFRVVWGVVGGHWSRFGSFFYGPRSWLAYWRGDSGPEGRYDIGHSPLAAPAVWAMLVLLGVQVGTGLIADDEVATTGPLNRFAAADTVLRASGWHTGPGKTLLIALMLLHVAAVFYYLLHKRRNLVGPMWHGDQPLPRGATASRDSVATRLLALAIAVASVGLARWVWRLGAV